jgi:hypothetical protein
MAMAASCTTTSRPALMSLIRRLALADQVIARYVCSHARAAAMARSRGQSRALAAASMLVQVTTELDATSIRTHTKSRQEQSRWPAVLAQFGVPRQLLQGLHVGGGSTVKRAKKAAACLLLTTTRPFADIEQDLLQHTPENSAVGPIRQVSARTRDVIDAVANIALFYGKRFSDEDAIDDLALQLELGLPRQCVTIARKMGASLSRGDYLALLSAGVIDWRTASDSPIEQLRELVDVAKAELLKDTATIELRHQEPSTPAE